jgi:hypothetical protein
MPLSGRYRLSELGLLFLIFGAWLAARPYDGIWHDAVLYTAQALSRLHPEFYANDLFFRYGSQDSFTIFPAFHAAAIKLFGIEGAALIVTLVGKVLWFSALVWFLASILRGRAYWLGLALVASYNPYFDSHGVFSWGETFVTSRLYAEAFVLAALALAFRRLWVLAGAVLMLAVLLHPLVAIVGILLTGLLLLMSVGWSRNSLLLLSLLLCALSLPVILGISPFDRLLTTYDEIWLSQIQSRNAYVFLETWEYAAFSRIGLVAVILFASVYVTTSEMQRRLSIAALVALFLLLAAAWVGGSVLYNVLLTQLQLWRGLWLIQLVAWGLAANVLLALVNGNGPERLLAVLLVSAFLLEGVASGVIAFGALLLYFVLIRYQPEWKLGLLTVLVLGGVLLLSLLFRIALLTITADEWETTSRSGWLVFFFSPLFLIGMVSLLVWHIAGGNKYEVWVIGACLFYFSMCLLVFFASNPSPPKVDQQELTTLRQIIPSEAAVYRPGGLAYVWFLLQRSSYASGLQTAGVLFSRETANEASRRQQLLWSLGFSDGNPYWLGMREASEMLSRKPQYRPAQETIDLLCADRELGYLFLPKSGLLAGKVVYPPLYENRLFRLFDCVTVRAAINKMV